MEISLKSNSTSTMLKLFAEKAIPLKILSACWNPDLTIWFIKQNSFRRYLPPASLSITVMVTVNGKKVNIPSYQLKAGDVIEVREKSKQLAIVLEAVQSQTRDFPSYLEVDAGKLTAKYTFVPKFDDVPYAAQMEPNLVIEFYSR